MLFCAAGLPSPRSPCCCSMTRPAGKFLKSHSLRRCSSLTSRTSRTGRRGRLRGRPLRLVIGILGKDPFGPYLEEAVRGESVNGRPLVIQHFHRVEEIQNCQILFISDSEAKRLPDILAKLQGRSILTVSDMENFSPHGGMVRLLTVNNKMQLRINVDALHAAGLTMSSKVLRAAEIVTSANK